MEPFRQYHHRQPHEFRKYSPGEPLTKIKVAEGYKPKYGDMVARAAADHSDQWIVPKAHFEANFQPVDAEAPDGDAAKYRDMRQLLINFCRDILLDDFNCDKDDLDEALKLAGIIVPESVTDDLALRRFLEKEHNAKSVWDT